jgi:hypothetical protein
VAEHGKIEITDAEPASSTGRISTSGEYENIGRAIKEKVGGIRKAEKESHTSKDAAFLFMEACGLDPTPDAVDQLVEAFLPALTVICRRGYDPNGKTWRKGGWRGLLHELRKKTDRLLHRSWLAGRFDPDSALDLMNYGGFYYRLKNQGEPWGDLGEPGSAGTMVDDISMGDYSDLTGDW